MRARSCLRCDDLHGDAPGIGDRSHDAVGAVKNEVAFVGALYGYGTLAELREAGATRWVDRPLDLVAELFGEET